jgi:AcrR family transcriptional regulator
MHRLTDHDERHRTVNTRGAGNLLRDEITQAAERLLSRATSRDGVTLRAIARETGIAAPSIYRHFADRDAVLDAVVAATFQQLETVCERAFHHAATGIERVRAISYAYVAFAARHRSQYRILFERAADTVESGSPSAPTYPPGIRAFQFFSDALAQMVQEGDSDTTDPIRDAQTLWAALHGIVTLIPATPGFPWAPTEVLLEHLIERLASRKTTRGL